MFVQVKRQLPIIISHVAVCTEGFADKVAQRYSFICNYYILLIQNAQNSIEDTLINPGENLKQLCLGSSNVLSTQIDL